MSSSPYEVLVFDVAANVWSKLQPLMRRFLRLPSLVELGGGRQSEARVRMVAAVEKSRQRARGACASGPCAAGGGGGRGRGPRCSGADAAGRARAVRRHRGCPWVRVHVLAPRGPASPAPADVLVFDARSDEWRWAPPCPYPYARNGAGFRLLAYEPRLATPAIGLFDATAPMAFHGTPGPLLTC
jgi:hypothetical protein